MRGAAPWKLRQVIIVIECKRCGVSHRYKPGPGSALLCCSTPKGVTVLVARIWDPETKAKWCTITKAAKTVHFIADSTVAKHGFPWKEWK